MDEQCGSVHVHGHKNTMPTGMGTSLPSSPLMKLCLSPTLVPPRRCIWYGPDAEGLNGVSLGLNVVHEATRALTSALRTVAPTILTWRQIGEVRGVAAPGALKSQLWGRG